ncbi:hypothetical protein QBC47DRAFT_37863 [Echria macrotheca]|uniref:Uncharacterized protein n=1 Tax=Echria macrotheca TaxID=438768 RepID=A0AAJ0B9F2_9PEZI|nr:hypothetical protein QBC47DRAFT_37863 [Echria macrotheca]
MATMLPRVSNQFTSSTTARAVTTDACKRGSQRIASATGPVQKAERRSSAPNAVSGGCRGLLDTRSGYIHVGPAPNQTQTPPPDGADGDRHLATSPSSSHLDRNILLFPLSHPVDWSRPCSRPMSGYRGYAWKVAWPVGIRKPWSKSYESTASSILPAVLEVPLPPFRTARLGRDGSMILNDAWREDRDDPSGDPQKSTLPLAILPRSGGREMSVMMVGDQILFDNYPAPLFNLLSPAPKQISRRPTVVTVCYNCVVPRIRFRNR